MTVKTLVRLLAVALIATDSQAQQFKAGAITVDHPYARATAAGQMAGGGYLKLTNSGGADRLKAGMKH